MESPKGIILTFLLVPVKANDIEMETTVKKRIGLNNRNIRRFFKLPARNNPIKTSLK